MSCDCFSWFKQDEKDKEQEKKEKEQIPNAAKEVCQTTSILMAWIWTAHVSYF